MVPSYYVARETKRHVTVALNGDGGDESLAGYTRYWQMLLLERISNTLRRLPPAVRRDMMPVLLAGYGKHPSSTFFRVWKWLDETEKHGYEYAYGRRLSSFSAGIKDDLYSGLMKDSIGMFESPDLLSKAWKDAGDVSLLEKMLYSDMHLYLPEVLTVKMDIATMANSLEARSPFLDHKFIETAASLPPSFKFRGFTSKYILKRKLKGFLPDQLIRRKKMGFGMPLGEWFAGDLKGYLAGHLVSGRFSRREYFNPKGVKKMVEEHISGKAVHTARLWNLLVFEIWYRIFMEGEGFE
jgi:asparagine synthase (glutamine-hydrolysing)